jgi:hypothetical protein
MSITLSGATNQSVAVSGQSVDATVGVTGQSSQAVPAESAPAAAPHGGAYTDAAANHNTINFYATRDAAMAKIKLAINGELSVTNLDAPDDPTIGKIPLKATEVKIPSQEVDDGRIHAIRVGASEVDPLKLELTIPGVDLADPNARREALDRLAYKLKFVADNFKPLGHDNHHTPDAVRTEVRSFMTQFPQSAGIPSGFTPDEVALAQKSQNLATDSGKTDRAHTWMFFGEEQKSLDMNFSFNGDEKRIDAVEANLKARAAGIKTYFVESLLKSGKIDAAKAKKLDAELVILVEKDSSTPPRLTLHMGLPKSTVADAKSVSDLDASALGAIMDDKKLVSKVFENAVAFGETSGITDPQNKWTATFDMFGPTPFMHFLGDRIARIRESLPPEAKAKLDAEYTALQGEDLLGTWESQYALSHKGKSEIEFKVEEGGKVLMTLPVPEGMQRAQMWSKIANSEITVLPTAIDPLPPTNDVAPPAASSGTATPQNTAPIAAGQTNDGTNTTLTQGNTNTAAAPIADNSTGLMTAGAPTLPISSTTAANPASIPPVTKPTVGAGVWTGAAANASASGVSGMKR